MAARKQPQDRKRSLRDQLAKKRSRTTEVTFPLGEAGEKAAADLDEATQGLALLKMYQAQGKDVDLTKPQAAVDAAVEAYKDNSITFRFRGLSPDEADALRDEYLGGDDDAKSDLKGYTVQLLAAAALDSDLTAEEWEAELYGEDLKWSDGEVRKLRETAHEAYFEAPAPRIPKG